MNYTPEYTALLRDSLKNQNIDFLKNKTVFITGATGLICSFFIDLLLSDKFFNIKIIAAVRSIERAKTRFSLFESDKRLKIAEINLLDKIEIEENIDFVIHGASYTDPKNYALYPVDTMLVNIYGLKNALDLAVQKKARNTLFLSSCEIYGSSEDALSENMCGYIDCTDFRACYNEGKRAGEALCAGYIKQFGLKAVMPRLSRVYGPTMQMTDTKALSQFIKKALNNEDIVLKSEGNQRFSYCHVADAVAALILLLEKGESGNAYNIAGDELLSLKEIAQITASYNNKRVIFDLPSDTEKAGFSRAMSSILLTEKIKKLGFMPQIKLKDGIFQTIDILDSMQKTP